MQQITLNIEEKTGLGRLFESFRSPLPDTTANDEGWGNKPQYAVYYPSRQELHILSNPKHMLESTALHLVLHRPQGISGLEVEAITRMYRVLTDHNLAVIYHD